MCSRVVSEPDDVKRYLVGSCCCWGGKGVAPNGEADCSIRGEGTEKKWVTMRTVAFEIHKIKCSDNLWYDRSPPEDIEDDAAAVDEVAAGAAVVAAAKQKHLPVRNDLGAADADEAVVVVAVAGEGGHLLG